VTKEDLEEIGKTYGVDKISYPELVPEHKHWHEMLMQGYLHDKHFQKVTKQARSFGQGYTLRNRILYFTMDNQVQLCIPDSEACKVHVKNYLLDSIHQSLGHASYNKTYHAHQQKKSCVATHHLSLQCHYPVMSVAPVTNVLPSYVRSQLLCTLTLPNNALRPIQCSGYTYSALCPISLTSLHDFSL